MYNALSSTTYMPFANYMFSPFANFLWSGLAVLAVLDLVLKGFALWRSARNGQNYWFIALLIFNTAGILPAIYLLFFKGKKVTLKTKKR